VPTVHAARVSNVISAHSLVRPPAQGCTEKWCNCQSFSLAVGHAASSATVDKSSVAMNTFSRLDGPAMRASCNAYMQTGTASASFIAPLVLSVRRMCIAAKTPELQLCVLSKYSVSTAAMISGCAWSTSLATVRHATRRSSQLADGSIIRHAPTTSLCAPALVHRKLNSSSSSSSSYSARPTASGESVMRCCTCGAPQLPTDRKKQ